MATDPESDVLAKIATLAAWTENTNLFRGIALADEEYGDTIPRKSVFVQYTGGPRAESLFPSNSIQYREYNIQILVRGDPDKYGSTRTLAQAIYDLVHDGSISGYWFSRVEESAPVHVGQDERRSHLFNMTLTLRNAA
jgi:hypothetical protein